MLADGEDSFCEKACSIILYLCLFVQIIKLHDKTNQTRLILILCKAKNENQTRLILILCKAKNENIFESDFVLK